METNSVSSVQETLPKRCTKLFPEAEFSRKCWPHHHEVNIYFFLFIHHQLCLSWNLPVSSAFQFCILFVLYSQRMGLLPEERMEFRRNLRDHLYYRSLPLATGLGFLAFLGVYKGILNVSNDLLKVCTDLHKTLHQFKFLDCLSLIIGQSKIWCNSKSIGGIRPWLFHW